jgi:uncharacterized protein (TIGR02147 family)
MSESLPNLFEYLDFRVFLSQYIEFKKTENNSFSLRFMASRLECDPGFFARILKGDRNLSDELILKTSAILKFTIKQQRYFELLVKYNQAKKQAERDHYFEQLNIFRNSNVKQVSPEQFEMYSHWYMVVLRELLNIIPCKDDSDETFRMLARNLEPPINPTFIREAVEKLEQLGFLARKDDGTISIKEQFITTGAEIPQVIINRVILEFMELAKGVIDRFERKERSLSSITFSISPESFIKIKDKIDQFRREILSIVADDKDKVDRVYHLNLHLFPVSRQFKGK